METNEINKLALRAQAGDKKAIEELINFFIPIINDIAKKYTKDSYLKEELVEEGILILLKVVAKYDSKYKYGFDYYAKQNLKSKLDIAYKKLTNNVSVIYDYEEIYYAQCLLDDNEEEIDSENSSFEQEQTDEASFDILDTLVDKSSIDAYMNGIIKNIIELSFVEANISEKEIAIVKEIYGIDCQKKSVSDIARENNTSVSSIFWVKNHTLRKIKNTETMTSYMNNKGVIDKHTYLEINKMAPQLVKRK